MDSVIEIRESWQDFVPLNFPVEDIHLIVQLSVVVIDVFPYLVPHLQRIPTGDVLGYALAHPESSVRDISKACYYSKLTRGGTLSLRSWATNTLGSTLVITDDLMQAVRENRRFTITILSLEFPYVSRSVVYKIVTEDLNF
ncbi:uncharacterized protein TNCV_1800641 [Trichonephila clavipes]|nr:uncharacterized protein TNCV_1800641 [Trichonephila clavipes]